MREVAATYRSKVIALLRDRLDFERAAVRLYDHALEVFAGRDGPFESLRAHLRRIREEEKAHEEWLSEQVRALGGSVDAHPNVPPELKSLDDQISVSDAPAACLRALRSAEVADTAGWELLQELARRARDDDAHAAFEQRAAEEREHLLFVNRMAALFEGSDLLDAAITTLDEPAMGTLAP